MRWYLQEKKGSSGPWSSPEGRGQKGPTVDPLVTTVTKLSLSTGCVHILS